MVNEPDPRLLPLIEQALSEPGRFPAMPAGLWTLYSAAFDAERRPHNRAMVLLFTALLDLFILPEFFSEPNMVPYSCLLRLVLYTPCVVLFVALDRQGRLKRLYEPWLLTLAVTPCIIAALLCLRTVSVDALANVRAMPLILIFTGLVWRMRFRTVVVNAVLSASILIFGVVMTPVVPRGELASLIITNLATCFLIIVFARRLEWRDRRVFLLNANESMRRTLVTAQNNALLLDVLTDPLTGLANRRCFDEALSAVWLESMRARTPISLIMIDVDHFKAFNDHYGHMGGDECLQCVAQHLRSAVRAMDVMARYGGEEFAAILPGTELETATAVAERMRALVADMGLPNSGAGTESIVTISLGVSHAMPSDPQGAQRLLEAADRNLYAAKRGGRNLVAVHDNPAGIVQTLGGHAGAK